MVVAWSRVGGLSEGTAGKANAAGVLTGEPPSGPNAGDFNVSLEASSKTQASLLRMVRTVARDQPSEAPSRANELEAAARRRTEGLLALAVVQLCFGLFPVFGKVAMQVFDPRAVTAWRITAGALVLGGGALALFGKRALPSWRDLLVLQIAGTLGISLNQLLYLKGLSLSTATNAGVLVCLIPVFTYAIATIVRRNTAIDDEMKDNMFYVR